MTNLEDQDCPPQIDPSLRTIAMPADTNANGDIFGGWVMSQMDIAGSIPAVRRAKSRVATVAVTSMTFHKPVAVGDIVSIYATSLKVGRTSITVKVETWVERAAVGEHLKVTEAELVYVAIDEDGLPRPVIRT